MTLMFYQNVNADKFGMHQFQLPFSKMQYIKKNTCVYFWALTYVSWRERHDNLLPVSIVMVQ